MFALSARLIMRYLYTLQKGKRPFKEMFQLWHKTTFDGEASILEL